MNKHFASLVVGLAAQAQSVLEGNVPPGIENLDNSDPKQLAKALIDTLIMLEEKTKGNLNEEEQMVLDQTLTAIRFQFLTGQVH